MQRTRVKELIIRTLVMTMLRLVEIKPTYDRTMMGPSDAGPKPALKLKRCFRKKNQASRVHAVIPIRRREECRIKFVSTEPAWR